MGPNQEAVSLAKEKHVYMYTYIDLHISFFILFFSFLQLVAGSSVRIEACYQVYDGSRQKQPDSEWLGVHMDQLTQRVRHAGDGIPSHFSFYMRSWSVRLGFSGGAQGVGHFRVSWPHIDRWEPLGVKVSG